MPSGTAALTLAKTLSFLSPKSTRFPVLGKLKRGLLPWEWGTRFMGRVCSLQLLHSRPYAGPFWLRGKLCLTRIGPGLSEYSRP